MSQGGSVVKCPACFCEKFSQTQPIPEISVQKCLGCGLLVSNIVRTKPAAAEFDRINQRAYFNGLGTVRAQQAVEALSFVTTYTSTKGDWLDVGCSFGYLLSEARRSGFEIFGIEPDQKACEHARDLLGEKVIHLGLMTPDVRPDASADVVSLMDVLEHVPAGELMEFGHTIRKKVRAGGLVLFKVPSTDGLYFQIANRMARITRLVAPGMIKRLWQSEYEFPHTVYFNERSLRAYLENHGFEVVARKYIEDVPNQTVIDRLVMDDTVPRWQAYLLAPAFYLINFAERIRAKSDAMLMLARPAGPDTN
jgi:2-polyprenyl-3-methyl-5-hydroxy-6-metoxy-1,4-benzoquinol methylase